MAKAPINVPAPPMPPAPDTPPELTAPSAGTEPVVPPPPPAPSPTDTPVGTEPGSTQPGNDAEQQAGATNANEAQPGTSSDTPVDGPGEIDGGDKEPHTVPADDGGVNGPVTRDAELHGAVKASDYNRTPDTDEDFVFTDPKLTEAAKTEKIAKKGFLAGRRGAPVGTRRKGFTDDQWARYQASHSRGVTQGEADAIENSVERIERIERALGLAIPGAVIYAEDDE